MKILKSISPSEEQIHITIAEYLNFCLDDSVVWTTVEQSNQDGSKRGFYRQVKLKRKGVLKGWPDIQIFWPPARGLLIEVKSQEGIVKPHQVEVQDRLRRVGFNVEVCRCLENVRQVLIKYKVPMKNNILL